MMKTIDVNCLQDLIEKAGVNPRKRTHYNLHTQFDDPVQRLCVIARSGTYIRPHRHEDKWELFIIVEGSASFLTFDDSGVITERVDMSADGKTVAAEVTSGIWHTIVITSDKTVLFEIKPGPFKPSEKKDFASWSPEENSSQAAVFEKKLHVSNVGSKVNC